MEDQGRCNLMAKDKTRGLKEHAKKRTEIAKHKVDKAIRFLSLQDKKINFNAVKEESGVSKSFLYQNQEIRDRIESLRKKQIDQEMNQIARKTKTKEAKDILIKAKDKKIKDLKQENDKLKNQLKVLRGKIYENKY